MFSKEIRPKQNYILDYETTSNEVKHSVWKITFQMLGLPHEQAFKTITISPNQTVEDIKRIILKEFRLNPLIDIQLLFRGKVLSELNNINDFKISPEEDTITVMAVMN
ncbi:MAG: ubiquitin-like protein, partial [Promethearchaeota archaeon]